MKNRRFLGSSIVLLLIVFLTGCGGVTFHSNQFLLIKSAFEEEPRSDVKTNWFLDWDDVSYSILPTSVNKETWFITSKDTLIRFDGWQIIEVTNLLPGGVKVFLQKKQNELEILNGMGVLIKAVQCQPWKISSENREAHTVYDQNCSEGKTSFTNSIHLDGEGMIIKLKFTVHPNYPPLVLRNSSV